MQAGILDGHMLTATSGWSETVTLGGSFFAIFLQFLHHHLRHFLDVAQRLFPSVSLGRRALNLQFGNVCAPHVLVLFEDDAQNERTHCLLLFVHRFCHVTFTLAGQRRMSSGASCRIYPF